MDFDWPINEIWPGYMISICAAVESDCEKCKHFARLAHLPLTDCGCPHIQGLEVPKGKGYQLWETCTEGSPTSPVFDTPEKLARWLVDNNASSFGSQTESYETWLKFIKGSGWAPSALLSPGNGMISGVRAYGEKTKEED